MPMQYTEIFKVVKIFDIFIFAQNIDCWYMIESPW